MEGRKDIKTVERSLNNSHAKKRDKTICRNYRGIVLLDATYKAIKNRLNEQIENKIGDYQGGFRQNRSTIDQIFTLKHDQNLTVCAINSLMTLSTKANFMNP